MGLSDSEFKDSLKLKKAVFFKSVIVLAAFFSFIFLFVFSPLVLAEFDVGNPNYSISKAYGPNLSISGWVNMSFQDESADSVFTASFDGEAETSINLEEMLELNPGYSHSCTPVDCGKDYSANNPQTTKNLDMDSEPKTIGLVFEGEVISIDSVKFNVESNAGSSCQSQLKIDFLDDGKIDLLNNKTGTGVCSGLKNYGCFNDNEALTEFVFEAGKSYCQKINLSESPGFRLGAWIKKVSGSSAVNASLYDLNGVKKGSCALPSITSTTGQEYYCDLDYLVLESEDYYVCFSATGGDANYRIRGYTDPAPLCGFPYLPAGPETAAYQIFAEGKEFAGVGSLNVGTTLPSGEDLSSIVYNYLVQRYGISSGKTDCSAGCIVPVKITPSVEQTVSFKNLESKYSTTAGTIVGDKFYDIAESPAKITSENFQKLRLDNAEFRTPEETGNYTFTLNLNSEEIISEEIEVKNVPIIKSVEPTLTTTGLPTTFEVKVTLPGNTSIGSYTWEFFDDGNITRTETTTINKVIHIYNEVGTYDLKISITDTKGFSSSKTFEINVTSPKELINTKLDEIDKNIERINSFTSVLPLFQKTAINSVLRLENVSSQLERLEQEYNDALTPEENLTKLNEIVGELLEIRIPNAIFKSTQADSSLFFPDLKFIDMDVIQAVAGGNYTGGNEENYKKAVSVWQQQNLGVTFDFNEFSADYDAGTESLVSTLEFVIEEKSDLGYDYFIFIPALEGIGFDKSMQQKNDFYYTALGDKSVSRIGFYTTEDIGFTEVPVFISPSVSRLSVAGPPLIPEGKPKILIFVLVMILLVILGIVAYIILFQWYKKKYEGYLFPNRNDLYNVVHYVNRSKRKGVKNKEITKNLKKAGWNSEQIRYVMRKYEGKRTGMVEIPITRLIRKIERKKKEDQKGRPSNHRSHPGHYGSHRGY